MHMAHLKDRYITMRWRYEYGCSKDRNIRTSCVPYESMNNSLSADWSRTSCEPLWTSCLIRQKGSREQSGNSKAWYRFHSLLKIENESHLIYFYEWRSFRLIVLIKWMVRTNKTYLFNCSWIYCPTIDVEFSQVIWTKYDKMNPLLCNCQKFYY